MGVDPLALKGGKKPTLTVALASSAGDKSLFWPGLKGGFRGGAVVDVKGGLDVGGPPVDGGGPVVAAVDLGGPPVGGGPVDDAGPLGGPPVSGGPDAAGPLGGPPMLSGGPSLVASLELIIGGGPLLVALGGACPLASLGAGPPRCGGCGRALVGGAALPLAEGDLGGAGGGPLLGRAAVVSGTKTGGAGEGRGGGGALLGGAFFGGGPATGGASWARGGAEGGAGRDGGADLDREASNSKRRATGGGGGAALVSVASLYTPGKMSELRRRFKPSCSGTGGGGAAGRPLIGVAVGRCDNCARARSIKADVDELPEAFCKAANWARRDDRAAVTESPTRSFCGVPPARCFLDGGAAEGEYIGCMISRSTVMVEQRLAVPRSGLVRLENQWW